MNPNAFLHRPSVADWPCSAAPRMAAEGDAAQTKAASASVKASLKTLILPVYVPCFVAACAQSLVIPVLPLFLKSLGAADATIGTVASMQGLGAFCSAFFNGMLVGHVGERCGMLLGTGVRCAMYALCIAAALPLGAAGWSTALFAIARLGTGIGMSCFQIARQSWVAASVPKQHRGRANSLIGGVARLAQIVGPLLGGVVMGVSGAPAAFTGQFFLGVAMLPLLALSVPRTANAAAAAATVAKQTTAPGGGGGGGGSLPPWLPNLLASAPVGFSFSFVRAARQLLIPLKGRALELSPSAVGGVTAASFLCDALFFPAAGFLMDGYGRKWAGVPSLLLMACGLLLLGAARSSLPLLVASALLGMGNGLSSGLVMTIGQDAAPEHARSRFLGLFKVASDSGIFVGPMVVGLVSEALSLDIAAFVVGGASAASAAWYAAFGRESLVPRTERAARKHARLDEAREVEACSSSGNAGAAGATSRV